MKTIILDMIEWFNQHWDGKCQHPTHVWFKLFFFVCVWVCEEPPKHAARQSMLFYDISIFLKPMQWFEAPWIGKISKTGWWSLLAQSWQWTTNQFFFLHFFWLAMGISQGEDGPGEQLERGPHRFPARHLCDSVNSSRPKGPSLRWKW